MTAAHCLAELYAVLTRLPLRPRIAPALAWKLLNENVLGRARIVSLTAREYRRALEAGRRWSRSSKGKPEAHVPARP